MDRLSPSRRSWNMSRIRSGDTSIEWRVRKYLWSKKYRYRVHYGVPGRPDIAFVRQKIAIFINGCFWHRHGCRLSYTPKTSTEFWAEKLERNVMRDKKVLAKLRDLGWVSKTVWECDIKSDFASSMATLMDFIRENSNR